MAKTKKRESKTQKGNAKPGATKTPANRNTTSGAKPNTQRWAAGQFSRNALRSMTKDALLVLCRELRLDVVGMTKTDIVEIVLREQAKATDLKSTTAPETPRGATARPVSSGKVAADQKPTAKRTSIRLAVWSLFDQHQTTDPKVVTLEMATEAARTVKPDTAFSASHRAFYARKWRDAQKGSDK